jgi:hypothetical protein
LLSRSPGRASPSSTSATVASASIWIPPFTVTLTVSPILGAGRGETV